MKNSDIKKIVREGYTAVAKGKGGCCGPTSCNCGSSCGSVSKAIGYSDKDMASVPDGANLGLGCGNPIALASLKPGETVLDLGSGAGFDCFLAARRVGRTGRVIGVDMTPEMLKKARANAAKGGYTNVEFRKGEIEKLPVEDDTVDIIISNCVINLSPDKQKVFDEAFRVLKPGGRLMVSDIVLKKELPAKIRKSAEAYVGCLSGAIMLDKYLGHARKAGFTGVKTLGKTEFPVEMMLNDATVEAFVKDSKLDSKAMADAAKSVLSVKLSATKPGAKKGKPCGCGCVC